MLKSIDSGLPVLMPDEFGPNTDKTLCISGHREKSIIPYQHNKIYSALTISAVKLMLYRYIDMAIERGFENFISGLATGIDLWAAEYIIKKKQSNSNITLIGVMPYLRHAEVFPADYKKLLKYVEKNSDILISTNSDPEIIYKKTSPEKYLYRDRNYYMVDRSSAIIAFLNNNSSYTGTRQTVSYGYKTGRRICRFSIEDIFKIIDECGTDIRNIRRHIAFLENTFDFSF
ncbi:MAG: SLOG family protein [Ruminococcus flavefaciens]|nr:SLOG family protein [Ruminococcus flavefaciens]MCM1058917.1 SLOG family protein [Eubacterium sp.]